MVAAKDAREADQGAQASAVEEIDLREIQNYVLGFERDSVDGGLKGLDFVARDDAAFAADDGDVSESRVL